MKTSRIPILQTILLLSMYWGTLTSIAAQPCKEVVGYYPNWQWYDRAKLVNPASIDYSKYTILNYAFLVRSPMEPSIIPIPGLMRTCCSEK